MEKRVAHIAKIDIKTSKKNGLNICIPQYIEQMNLINIKSILVVPSDENYSEILNGIKVFYVKDKLSFKKIIIDEKITDVFFHAVTFLFYYKIYNYLVKNNIRYYIVTHGSLSKVALHKNFKKRVFNLLLVRRFVKKADAICFHIEAEHEHSAYKNKKYYLLKNYFSNYNPKVKKEKKKESCINFILLGRLDIFYKGIDLLIDSLSLIRDELLVNGVKFNLYGYYYEKTFPTVMKNITSKGLEKIVLFKGPIYGEEKFKVLADSDISILPSRTEGFPLSLGDSLYVGTPVLITDNTNCGEYVEKFGCGWITDFNAEHLAQTINNSIKDIKKDRELYIKKAKEASKFIDNIDLLAQLKKILSI